MDNTPLYIGIDPGKTGAVAFLRGSEGWGEIVDTGDGYAVAELIRSQLREHASVHAAIEKVSAFPGQGVSSSFNFGASWGVARGVCAALQIPVTLVTPQRWNKLAFQGRNKPSGKPERKAAVLQIARERWPRASLKRVKDGAIGEALFMALVAQRDEGGI